MNRNQKIALGCGGAGCLGLIVLAVVGVLGYTYMYNSSPFANQNRNSNFNLNANLNSNDNSTANSNAAVDEDTSSSMSDDDKHKLFQAAGMTGDSQLTMKVLRKIGFPSGTGEEFQKFTQEHFDWARRNLEFIKTVNTPEEGRAYVEAHLDD
ncbi:MAG: hypothetical protein M3447_00650 [Acidobacteriota bacterium]|nr:hypothetical protein [Acidobacteriota bacterium]